MCSTKWLSRLVIKHVIWQGVHLLVKLQVGGSNKMKYLTDREAAIRMCSVKKVFLEISQNSQENTCTRACFLIKFQAWASNFTKKETLIQVFSCEFCGISKNTYFTERLWRLLLQIFLKVLTSAQNLHCRTTIFAEHLPMTASTFKHDHDLITIKSAESLKLFWYGKVAAGRWI